MAYTETEARELVLSAGLELVRRGLIARTWGNISARISDTECIITPSGRSYDSLKPEELVKLNINDLTYPGTIKPSSEKGLHAEVYKLRPEINFIIHTHQYYASIVGLEGRGYPFAAATEYGMPGTGKLSANVAKAVAANPGQKNFFMTRHGSLSLGTDMDDAFAGAQELEDACEARVRDRFSLIRTDGSFKEDEEFIHQLSLAVKDTYGYAGIVFASEADVVERSRVLRPLIPRIDDFAMICGPDVKCVGKSLRSVISALRGRSAVLIENMGAVCVGNSDDDVSAVEMILSKNCACDRYAAIVPGCGRVSRPEAILQRSVYIRKYSKQKTKNV